MLPIGGRGARRLKIDPERFWTQPEKWPADLAGYVFLGRAVLQVAKIQVSPPEPMTLPFSPRAQRSYDIASERIAQEAASDRLKTATLDQTGLTPMRAATWAMIDRKVIFGCFFRFPGRVYRSGVYSESKLPIYVEAASLQKLVNWTRTMAEAAEATVAFERVRSDRFTYDTPPDMLPPTGFLSLGDAVARLQSADDDSASAAKARLRELAAAGEVQTIAQLWESGGILGLPAEIWPTHDAATMLEDGIVAIPEFHGASDAFSHWAFIRFRFAASQRGEAAPSTSSESGEQRDGDGSAEFSVASNPEVVGLTRTMLNLHTALLDAFGDRGGYAKKSGERVTAASAWRIRQNPRPAFPADLARAIRHLDEWTDGFSKSVKLKG